MSRRLPIKIWFHSIENEEVRKNAFNNLGAFHAERIYNNLSSALFHGFTWHETPEGQDYWERAYENNMNN